MDRRLRLMGRKDPRIDAYIAKSQDFAKPILKELRSRIHDLVPGVEEDIKWGFPSFMYNGRIFFGMSAFKAHAGCGFWHPLMRVVDKSPEGIGEFGKLTSVDQLPSRTAFAKLAKKAKKLEDDGVRRPPRPKPDPNRKVTVPKDLAARLAKNAKARATFEGFPYSKKNEYVTWINEAKREETRAKRLDTTLEQLAEGKSLRWKYEAKK
ncbi:MAG TPA: YdeI/OmpD-associated family protein [Usitatibacter sp.]|nr:YdeI/OmpD-associated family protein [Usitatibacter sp.]